MRFTPRTATNLLSARLLTVNQEKSQFFPPLSTCFITLFKRHCSIFQPDASSPLPPPDHGNLSACRAHPSSPQCLPAFVSSVRSSSVYHGLLHTQQQATFSNFSNSSDSKGKVKVKGPNMCYIFEKHGIQGYQI